jgi:hypothetical protein
MATLNAFTAYGVDEDDEDNGAAASPRDTALSWQWATWPHPLRTAVIASVIALLSLVALVLLVEWADKDLSKKLQTQNNAKTQAQARLANSDQERNDIDKHLPLLHQLEQMGVFGEEKRLEWIEVLRLIEKRWPGVKLQYNIAAQIPMPETEPQNGQIPLGYTSMRTPLGTSAPPLLPSGEPAQNFGAFQSDMRLTSTVLHEGDVLALIDELKAAKLGRFTVKQCNYKRPHDPSRSPIQSNAPFTIGTSLEAECVLTWISMKAYTP